MKLCHMAMLGVVGWYLMAPRAKDVNLPIGNWNHVVSFDTTAECERDRVRLESENRNDPIKSKLILLSECIASDDPRLKGK